MNATIQNLVGSPAMKEAVCMTGECGWNNILTWCVELRSECQFSDLDGGELVFLPKLFMKMTSGNVEKLFQSLNKYHVSGVVFGVENKFSGTLLEYVKEQAKKWNIAVFCVVGEVNALSCVKDINKEICYLENSVLMEESLLTDFLFKDRKKLICAMERLENCEIDSLGSFELAVVKNQSKTERNSSKDYKYRLLKNECMRKYGKQILVTLWEEMMILAFQVEGEGMISQEVVEVLETSVQNVFTGEEQQKIRITLGRSSQPMSAIRGSFDEALFTMEMYELLDNGKTSIVKTYDETGVYRILRNCHNPDEFTCFYLEKLGELEEYDKQNNSELVETLRIYIENNCSLMQTAQVMYLHKNTLRYRIQRIEELISCDLKDIKVISDFYLCFQIQNYMGVAIHS